MLKNIADFLLNADPFSIEMITILVVTGFVVGFINTLAGMASSLSYALFMAMGMPINVANGTTRFGIFSQFLVNSILFKKKGLLDIKLAVKVGIPITVGSLIGAYFAAMVNPRAMEIVMGVMLPILAALLLYNQSRGGVIKKVAEESIKKRFGAFHFVTFIIIGVYGGFTHAGVGILILFGSIYLLGLDMLRSNGIKQFAVLMYTPLALGIFIWYGQVNWPVALIYAIGNVAGGVIASKMAFKWGVKIINYVVAIAVFGMSFWLIYKQFI
ncbi:MAG: hypothetical protein CVU13_01015 [Bacteroidetes bacterium HGW-Bacteroidetes-8]|nr:MAG: hypothetical protein CVU13_01015 [Bacteroidetes bacterium HGW-Bacteroidetes-8]